MVGRQIIPTAVEVVVVDVQVWLVSGAGPEPQGLEIVARYNRPRNGTSALVAPALALRWRYERRTSCSSIRFL
jgi:hypothetical protein